MNSKNFLKFRKHFSISIKNHIYFNSASSTLTLNSVIKDHRYLIENNLFKKVNNELIDQKDNYSIIRKQILNLVNAFNYDVIFTWNTTHSLNLISSLESINIVKGDEIIISDLEHLSNIAPWKKISESKKSKLVLVKTNNDGTVNLDEIQKKINSKTRIVSINHLSNTFSSENDIEKICELCKKKNIKLIIDGTQAFGKVRIDFRKYSPDYYVFSGHKSFGLDSLGIIIAKKELIRTFNPVILGGKMNRGIDKKYNVIPIEGPEKFEAGTKNTSTIISYSKSLEFINNLDLIGVKNYLIYLANYTKRKLSEIDNIEIINNNSNSIGTVLFRVKNQSSEDVYHYLLRKKIIVSQGYLCSNNHNSKIDNRKLVRISFHIYNTEMEINKLVKIMKSTGDFLDGLF